MAQLPIADVIRTRLQEYDQNFEVRKGTAFDQLFFKPSQFMLQPFRDEADELFIGQSLRRILQQDDPDAFNEELVDDLVANVFVERNTGDRSSGVVRVYYASPVNREYPTQGFTAVGSNSLNYVNISPFAITAEQMSAQIENGLYYFDIPVISQDLGKDTELDEEGIVSVVGDDEVISVTNKSKILGGDDRETNTELIARAKEAITVRDLVTGKGFSATLYENFPSTVKEIQAIGFGDREMMRDILFNAHVGGKHDGWIKTSYVTTKEADFLGVLVDTTRQTLTISQAILTNTDWISLGESSIDRSLGIAPKITEVRPYIAAEYTSPVSMGTPIDLSGNYYVKITIDAETKTVQLAGSTPSTTSRNEIITAINQAFGIDVAFAQADTIRLLSPTQGKDSRIIIEDPDAGTSALIPVFGDPTPETEWNIEGDGPITFIEGTHYEINDSDGEIRRIVPASNIIDQDPSSTAEVSGISGAIPWVGAQTVTSGGDTVVLSPYQCLILASFADPQQGDKLVISDSSVGNDGEYYVASTDLVNLGGVLNYRRITATRRFFSTEDSGTSPVQVAFPTSSMTSTNPIMFALVEQFDILTILGGTGYDGDYRVREVVSPDEIILDGEFSEAIDFTNKFYVKRTGIKNNELVYAEFYYNPLSIDIGKNFILDEYGRERGIRSGREDYTITDVAFLKINSIEIIDPISLEPLGEVLEGVGGYGRGGYGEGPYGIGSGAQYYLRVNDPTTRFSAFEDSYIVIDAAYQGFSFRVNYDCVPEIETIHDFCRSDRERVLDGDILVKHFIPAYVSGTIQYKVDTTDSSIPSNEDLTDLVKEFINTRPSNAPLEISDVAQYILSQTDPFRKYGGAVYPMTLTAEIHNTDGSTTILEGSSKIEVIEEDPFPLYTERPLTARTLHWLAGDIVLERVEG